MCLLTLATSPRITKEDITVYKLVEIVRHSELQSVNATMFPFTYEKDVLYQQQLVSSKKPSYFFDSKAGVEFGVNNLSDREGAYEEKVISLNINFIHDGFHSALNRERFAEPRRGEAIKEFKIPAGSQYYRDGSGLLVSNQIIYIGD